MNFFKRKKNNIRVTHHMLEQADDGGGQFVRGPFQRRGSMDGVEKFSNKEADFRLEDYSDNSRLTKRMRFKTSEMNKNVKDITNKRHSLGREIEHHVISGHGSASLSSIYAKKDMSGGELSMTEMGGVVSQHVSVNTEQLKTRLTSCQAAHGGEESALYTFHQTVVAKLRERRQNEKGFNKPITIETTGFFEKYQANERIRGVELTEDTKVNSSEIEGVDKKKTAEKFNSKMNESIEKMKSDAIDGLIIRRESNLKEDDVAIQGALMKRSVKKALVTLETTISPSAPSEKVASSSPKKRKNNKRRFF